MYDNIQWTDYLVPPVNWENSSLFKLSLKYGKNILSVRNNINDIIYYLDWNCPIILGIPVNNAFYTLSPTNYIYNLKLLNSSNILYNHCVVIIGYDIKNKSFICRNSYGSNFCIDGYFYLAWDILPKCFDLFVII